MNYLKFNPAMFQSKVARRVTLLFLISALVPLITTAYLSKTYINEILTNQSYASLQNEGRFFGRTLFDRLLFLELRLKNIARQVNQNSITLSEIEKHRGNEFTSLRIEKPISNNQSENSNPLKRTQLYYSASKNTKAKIFMSTNLDMQEQNKNYKIIAEINYDYIWETTEDLMPAYNICIISESGRVLLCTAPVPDNILTDNTPRTYENKKIWQWADKNENYISTRKIIFLKSRFESENWKTIITQAEKDTLLPTENFNRLFPLIIILTLLVVLLLSITQIQRSLIPLQSLISGTRRVAKNNFQEDVKVNSNDEFSELATSFNEMTCRLRKQFSSFKVLADIDQLILTGSNSDNIYLTVLEHINIIAPCDITSITVFDEDASNIGKTYIAEFNNAKQSDSKRIKISDNDIEKLKSPSEHIEMLRNAKGDHFLAPFNQLGVNDLYIFPVSIDDNLSAIITTGFINQSLLKNEDVQQLQNIADRIAVALSAASRDKKLYQQSYYDSLTSLPNRQLLTLRIEQEIKHCQRTESTLAILFLDLDRFKNVNDSLGHTIGDALLKNVSSRLLECVRETDTVARLGGDEFTIMLTGSLSTHDIRLISDNIIKKLSKPFVINTHEIFIGTSIGISVYPNDGKTVTELLKNADTAMYRVKENGRGKHLFFEEKMNIEEMERAGLELDMRHALERNEFILQYQPLIELKSGKMIGAEALIRWNHPKRGLVPSLDFISLAEETGIIEVIGEWVIRTACTQLKSWLDNDINLDRIAINVSSRQFLQNNFEHVITSVLEETDVPAHRLELEITETVLMDDRIDSMRILESLSKKKIHLSIDDFGTGFSSLSYLKRFPVNTLKIDRSFMQDVPADDDANTIVKSIITLAHTLNLSVIAEGIESAEQLALLFENNCDYAQGYYFSKPLNADEFEQFYLKHNNLTKLIHC